MPKQYFFQAGVFRDLSLAELTVLFGIYGINKDVIHFFSDDLFIIKSNKISEDLLFNIFNRLGGFIRFGEIVDDLDSFLDQYIKKEKRVLFGLSYLGDKQQYDGKFLKRLGTELKKGFKEVQISSRFLFPQGKDSNLNAAQLINNQVLEKGFELCILKSKTEELYGKTLAIQDMEGYIERDIKRPYSDIKTGVLPPKLARIMVNLAGIKRGTIWDPFCGSGTIPMESAILGYDFLASDKDKNAIFYTSENIKWLNEKGYTGDIRFNIFELDIFKPNKEIVKKLKNSNISAIVCEPFMGPPQKKEMSVEYALKLLTDVKSLYTSLFTLLDKEIGVRGINMVLLIPSYKTKLGWKTFGIREIASNRWELLNSKYIGKKDLKWSRKNSIITRNIFILRRK